MNTIRLFYDSVNGIIFSLWGISIVRVASFVTKNDVFSDIDKSLTTGVAAIGLIIMFSKAIHTIKMNKKNQKEKDLLNEALDIKNKISKEELERIIDENEKKTE